MNKKNRMEKAQDRVLKRLDYVTDCHEAPDFVEVTSRIGGDMVTYRVYDGGSMYER